MPVHVPSKQPERYMRVDGGHEAFVIKLRALLSREDALLRARTQRAAAISVVYVLALLVAFRLVPGDLKIVLGFVGAVIGLIGGLILWNSARASKDELQRGRHVQRAVEGLKPDFHPRTPVHGAIDLSESSEVPAERTARSPYSGATKSYHRHQWLDMRWGMADGNMLSMSMTDLVKLKSGAEMRRTHQLRGKLRVNAAHYRVDALKPFQVGAIKAHPVVEGDRTDLYFWGEMASVEQAFDAIRAVYARLERVRS